MLLGMASIEHHCHVQSNCDVCGEGVGEEKNVCLGCWARICPSCRAEIDKITTGCPIGCQFLEREDVETRNNYEFLRSGSAGRRLKTIIESRKGNIEKMRAVPPRYVDFLKSEKGWQLKEFRKKIYESRKHLRGKLPIDNISGRLATILEIVAEEFENET